MIIRRDGGSSGVCEYLRTGRKAGRSYTRETLDERIPLFGDLGLTEHIIEKKMITDGVRYDHVTLSFAEDHVDEETLVAVTKDFIDAYTAAYEPGELAIYAEAHIPRMKSYFDLAEGSLVDRKTHIHIVIPYLTLSDDRIVRLHTGADDLVVPYIDAIQEDINHRYGLVSPKDRRRPTFEKANNRYSRYRGDVFKGANSEIRNELLDELITRKVSSFDELAEMLKAHGTVVIRNKGKPNAYLNITLPGQDKGINLKDYVFTDEFLTLPQDRKYAFLAQSTNESYQEPGQAKRTPDSYADKVTEWKTLVALEHRYLPLRFRSEKNEKYQEYLKQDVDGKLAFLKARKEHLARISEDKRREKHEPGRELGHRGRVKHRRPINVRATGANRRQGDFTSLGGLTTLGTAPRINLLRNMPMGNLDGNSQKRQQESASILPSDETTRVDERRAEHNGRLRWAESGRRGRLSQSSYYHEKQKDKHEDQRTKDATSEYIAQATRNMDGEYLLLRLQESHGINKSKYQVVQKNGLMRIKAGTRHYNAADFLTKEMHLPWHSARELLLKTYQQQLDYQAAFKADKVAKPSKGTVDEPRAYLWESYRQWRENEIRQLELAVQKAKSKYQIACHGAKQKYNRERQGLINEHRSNKSASTALQLSRHRLEYLKETMELRNEYFEVVARKNAIKSAHWKVSYTTYLQNRVGEGSVGALDELRRLSNHIPETKEGNGYHQVSEGLQKNRSTLMALQALSYRVDEHGCVSYLKEGRVVFSDGRRLVTAYEKSDEAVELSLRLSILKFGSTLSVHGSDDFKRQAARIAAQSRLQIQFTDATAQKFYQEAIAEQSTPKKENAIPQFITQEVNTRKV